MEKIVCSFLFSLIFVMAEWYVIETVYSYIFSRRCKYDCKKCKQWSCPAKRCAKKRKQLSDQTED